MSAHLPFRCGIVGIVGRPNVGKSTLVNRLVGQKIAIVADVPQTTRHRIQGIVNRPGGQIVLVDTPGIHRPRHAMNRWMVAQTGQTMSDCDLVVMMVEAVPGPGGDAAGFGPGDRFVLGMLRPDGPKVLLAINKVDGVRKEALLPRLAAASQRFPFAGILMFSALTGENAHDLADRMLAHLPEGPALYPEEQFTDQVERQLVSEFIREKILHNTRQEIPHETCVIVETFQDGANGVTRIEATILVEKDSQRGILIGKDGGRLKTVGTEARLELEALLGRRLYIELWVKVAEGWRDDDRVLRRLGMG